MRIKTTIHMGKYNQFEGYVDDIELLGFQQGRVNTLTIYDEPEYEPTIGEQLTLEDFTDVE